MSSLRSNLLNNNTIDDLCFYAKDVQEKTQDPDFIALKKEVLAQLDSLLKDLQTTLSKLGEETAEHTQTALNDLEKDYWKIKHLKLISLTGNQELGDKFCVLSDTISGVTEKISLVTYSTVVHKLSKLLADMHQNLDYFQLRRSYQLPVEAMLKLPKHGDVTEIQREGVALTISKLLGFNTANFKLVTYQSRPALFVLFSPIDLMEQFAEGQEITSPTGKKYIDYSTIKAFGEGLQPDCAIEDFGNVLAFLYLCGDADAMGGYNQNKALIDAKHFFIFDQVIKSGDNFYLDSMLNLVPVGWKQFSRHTQGRNMRLIEDSSFTARYDSTINLHLLRPIITELLDQLHTQYDEIITKLSTASSKDAIILKNITLLRDDLVLIKSTIAHRFEQLFSFMPKFDCADARRTEIIKHALLLEKLINVPRLYTEDGRPYKYPLLSNSQKAQKTISSLHLDKENVFIDFNISLEEEYLKVLKNRMRATIKLHVNKQSLLLTVTDLLSINEASIFPEYTLKFKAHEQYLLPVELKWLASTAYSDPINESILEEIRRYTLLKNVPRDIDVQLQDLATVISGIESFTSMANDDKGFAKHVMKKLQFDIQKELQHIINEPTLNAKITTAFNQAICLDRMSSFNKLLIEVIEKKLTHDDRFLGFLDDCVNLNIQGNYRVLKNASQEMQAKIQLLGNYIKTLQKSPSSGLKL